MRAFHVIAEMGSGGAEAVVAELATAFAATGDEVWVASAGGRREPGLRAEGVHLLRTPLHHRSAPGVAAASLALVRGRATRPDVVHAHNVGAAVVAHLGTRWPRRRPPLVATFHGVADADLAGAARWLRRTADLVVAVSTATAQRLRDHGFPEDRLRVVDNAVTTPPSVDRAEAREQLGLDADAPVVLCAARLVPQKRHDNLLRAFALVPRPATLLLAGTGPLRADVEAQADGDVRLLGERSDVPALLAAADVFALASDWEGLPMAVLEAMAAGVPVVATAVDGLVAGTAPAAMLVPPNDPDALGVALAEVLADPARRAAMADAGRALVRERYAPEVMVRGYRAVYAELGVPDSVR